MGKAYTVKRGERTTGLDSVIVGNADVGSHHVFDVHQELGTVGRGVEEDGLDPRTSLQ